MANWMIQCAERFLQPIYDMMAEEFLKSSYIHCDETRIQVLGEADQSASTQNWMWVYMTDENSESPCMVIFRYERTRGGYHPAEFLGDYSGYLTCDGYQPYHGLPVIVNKKVPKMSEKIPHFIIPGRCRYIMAAHFPALQLSP
ncbi:MAG: transposase [Clostridium sp.]